RGINLDGNQVEIEADELLARLFQHESDFRAAGVQSPQRSHRDFRSSEIHNASRRPSGR
ncbi:MAG: hypothetical protein EBX51_07745, partial [Acidimicrobiia bacterium]|nr:hypothetical protein [Acidimicrobiia bacterium]